MRLRLIIVLAFLCSELRAQELLANGSFEDENICTEYIKNCAPEGWIHSSLISNNYFDITGFAQHGLHFIGLVSGNNRVNGKRTFMRSRLLCGLRKGQWYQLQFFVRSRHAVIDSIGAYFSKGDFLLEKRSYTQIPPSVIYRDSAGLLNEGWQKIQLRYQANGDENFIAVGSFKKKEFKYSRPAEFNGEYYFYIDSVSFRPEDPHELLCSASDSVRTAIYDENERHTLLERKIAYYRKSPPVVVPSPVTELELVDTLIIPDILFATASSSLQPASFAVLDSFATALLRRPPDSLVVEGHTDSVGTLAYNNNLSMERSRAVASYLISKTSMDAARVITRHFAFLRPVASNQTGEGRQRNRRVEILVYRRLRNAGY